MSRPFGFTSVSLAVLALILPRAPASAQRPALRDVSGCPQLAELRRSLDSLEALDPTADAKAAAERGDRRFWAVMRYDVVVPAVPEPERASLTAANYRVFDHTGDGLTILECESATGPVTDSTDVRWNQAAYAYAAIYNQALLRQSR